MSTKAQTSKELFDKVSIRCSRLSTGMYSTSFSLGIRFLDKSLRDPIYSIYGFVRLADEIVDSLDGFDQETLLNRFEAETYLAIREKIGMNPILNSFQKTVNEFNIEKPLIQKFLTSMRMDLNIKAHNNYSLDEYILGSAEVVGLMCLRVFCKGNVEMYEALTPYAMKLGSAFQKINFLRDLNADYHILGRKYFPGMDFNNFDEVAKRKIEDEIAEDFDLGYVGIKKLPREARFGVYIAYIYYLSLFKKIKNTPSRLVLKRRIRIQNRYKFTLLLYSFFRHQFNLI
jgi:15-cis-phytoene synthase